MIVFDDADIVATTKLVHQHLIEPLPDDCHKFFISSTKMTPSIRQNLDNFKRWLERFYRYMHNKIWNVNTCFGTKTIAYDNCFTYCVSYSKSHCAYSGKIAQCNGTM